MSLGVRRHGVSKEDQLSPEQSNRDPTGESVDVLEGVVRHASQCGVGEEDDRDE